MTTVQKSQGKDIRDVAANKSALNSCLFELVDVERLDATQPLASVKKFELKGKPRIVTTRLLIAGGGMGGVAAALTACRLGLDTCLLEETSWLGGQMTSQGVSALDENFWVESSGSGRLYKEFRENVRNRYREKGGADGRGRFSPFIDPGNSWVTRLAFEPKTALVVLAQMIEPFVKNGKLTVLTRHKVVRVKKSGDKVSAVTAVDLDSGKFVEARCRYVLDATELGDLLPLAGVPYKSGAESKEETGEAHAPAVANPENVQDFTYPFVVDFIADSKNSINKPPLFDEFNNSGKFTFAGYKMFENVTMTNEQGSSFELLPFWEYRRLISRDIFPAGTFAHDRAMINWESNDLRGENIIDHPPEIVAKRLARGKFLSLGFLYWLQNNATRDNGGSGYPELKLNLETLGTTDGLSMYPYIRESRRIISHRTIVEKDIVRSTTSGARARLFNDSVGIGHYPVDIHGEQDVPGAGQGTRPFQVPCGALIQGTVRNLIPACKNIGTTHVTNGAYRLHPVEWAIGEAAATLAFVCIKKQTDPQRLWKNRRLLRSVQHLLVEAGTPLFWFDDVTCEHKNFAAIQFVSATGITKADPETLEFRPDSSVTRREAAASLNNLISFKTGHGSQAAIVDMIESDDDYLAVASAVAATLFAAPAGNFRPNDPLSVQDMEQLARHKLIAVRGPAATEGTISRADFAQWLYEVAAARNFFAGNPAIKGSP